MDKKMNVDKKMKHVWVVLANSISANFYSISENDFHFRFIKTISHPESKLRERDLDADRSGHYEKGSATLRGTFAEPTTHKELEKINFAKQICQELDQGRINHACNGIIIVAEPHFYGLIHKHANHFVQHLIKFHLSKDYIHYSEQDLNLKLKEELAHEIRVILIS